MMRITPWIQTVIIFGCAITASCSGARMTDDPNVNDPTDAGNGTEEDDDQPGDDSPDDADAGSGEDPGEDPGDDGPESAWIAGLRINEVAAAGTPEDWVELTNIGDAPLLLDGLFLTDDPTILDKAPMPTGMIWPGAFIQLEISDATTGFKLGSDEEFHVVAPSGTVIDSIDWDEGASPAGGSYGRIPDGTGDFVTLPTASPGAPNLTT